MRLLVLTDDVAKGEALRRTLRQKLKKQLTAERSMLTSAEHRTVLRATGV
jgi:hypothetical protein